MRDNNEKLIYIKNKCPICKNISKKAFHPFCSKRCSLIDLGKWLSEDYYVPTKENIYEDFKNRDD